VAELAVFWDRLTEVQALPAAWVVGVSAAAALLVVGSPRLWRMTRIVITIAHESGHAAASLATGRKLDGIRLHYDTSGETISRGKGSGLGIIVTSLAGYVTPPLLGVGTAALLATHRVNLLLSLFLLLLAVTLVLVRNWYGALAVLACGGALFAVIWLASPALRAGFGYAAAWFLLFGGLRPVVELARTRGRRRSYPVPVSRGSSRHLLAAATDADQLARLTRLPAGLWVAFFGVVALVALVAGARLLIPWPAHLPAVHQLGK
jgi:hypothetical protein